MKIYPAIDLLDGKCVRLLKGDFNQKTVYSENPFDLLSTFEAAGADCLHLVDLSGAKDPSQRQLSLISSLVKATSMKIQCGGGIRSLEEVRALLDCGVERVVLGSMTVSNPELSRTIMKEFGPRRITLAVDVASRNGAYWVAINGWKTITKTRAIDLISSYRDLLSMDQNTGRVLCTDIGLDGMMQGPNIKLYQELNQLFPGIDFQASGGMSRAEDLRDLKEVGVQSVIIGKAIYEGTISLKDVLYANREGSRAH